MLKHLLAFLAWLWKIIISDDDDIPPDSFYW